MFKFIKELFNKAGGTDVTVTPTEKSLEQLIKEHNERIPLAYQKAIEEGKISEPVISFCDTVIENPARFKIVHRYKADSLFIDKLTGKEFEFSNEAKWVANFLRSKVELKNLIEASSPYNTWKNFNELMYPYQGTLYYIVCKLLLTEEEGCYVDWRLNNFLHNYYNERNKRLLALKTERNNRAIAKERKELMGIYCKQS